MIPYLILGVGALIGAGVKHALDESEKKTLREQTVRLEQQHAKLSEQVRKSATREVQSRKEMLRVTLEWSKSRLETLLAENDQDLERLELVFSIGRALDLVTEHLPANGVLAEQDRTFVEIVMKAQRGERLTRVDRAQLEDYLDMRVGDLRRDFLEDRLANAIRREKSRLGGLLRDRERRTIELHALRMRASSGIVESIAAAESRLQKIAGDIETTERLIDDSEQCLVVLTRVSRREDAKDADDAEAYDILQLLARGETLTEEERRFFAYYRDRHFRAARNILLQRRGIDLREAVGAN